MLTDKDKISFAPRQWLSDAALQFGCLYEYAIAQRSDRKRVILASRYYQTFVNRVNEVKRCKKLPYDAELEALHALNLYKEKWLKKVSKTCFVFINYHVNNNHWVSVLHMKKENKTLIFDSLKSGSLLNKVKNDLSLKEMLNCLGYGYEVERTFILADVRQQINGFDCGMHCIQNFKLLCGPFDELRDSVFFNHDGTKVDLFTRGDHNVDRKHYNKLFRKTSPLLVASSAPRNVQIIGNGNVLDVNGSECRIFATGNENQLSVGPSDSLFVVGDNNVIDDFIISKKVDDVVVPKRARQNVSNLSDKQTVCMWMEEQYQTAIKQGVSTLKGFPTKAMEEFPKVFNGKHANDLAKATRMWKSRNEIISSTQNMSLSATRKTQTTRTVHQVKSLSGRGPKTHAWVTWLHAEMLVEFQRYRSAGVKFSYTLLGHLARNILQDSEHELFNK